MIPKNPLTLMANGFLIEYLLNRAIQEMFPGYEILFTSGYRSLEDQEDLAERGLNPAPDSAHLYNLARDFTLINVTNGQQVSSEALEALYESKFKDVWPGYSYFSPAKKGLKGPHIHANLDREITEKTKILGFAGAAFVIFILIKQGLKKLQ